MNTDIVLHTAIQFFVFFSPFGMFRRALLESPLCWENYSQKFELLLYLEEQQMKVDIKRYNIPNNERSEAIMQRDRANKKLLVLEVLANSPTKSFIPSLVHSVSHLKIHCL